jgi:hypothetical protein
LAIASVGLCDVWVKVAMAVGSNCGRCGCKGGVVVAAQNCDSYCCKRKAVSIWGPGWKYYGQMVRLIR